MPQNKGKLYASTFKKFLNAALGVDYSIDDIQQGLVPNEVKVQITPKNHHCTCGTDLQGKQQEWPQTGQWWQGMLYPPRAIQGIKELKWSKEETEGIIYDSSEETQGDSHFASRWSSSIPHHMCCFLCHEIMWIAQNQPLW